MIIIIEIILIAVSLSMDAFALALSYGINNENKRNIIITAITVGAFHFFMPLLGDKVGNLLFTYTIIKPRYVLFFVFLILSIDMLINFFIDNVKNKPLTIIGTLFFALSVSIDSFSVGLGIDYLYDNLLFSVITFSIISALFTLLGFYLGKKLSSKIGKYSFLLGSITLFVYSFYLLTK